LKHPVDVKKYQNIANVIKSWSAGRANPDKSFVVTHADGVTGRLCFLDKEQSPPREEASEDLNAAKESAMPT